MSPSELMNILNRIIAKRKTCLCASQLECMPDLCLYVGLVIFCGLLRFSPPVFAHICVKEMDRLVSDSFLEFQTMT